MNIIKAEVLGMCFGVRDALALIEHVETPERVTIHGELVHNEVVLGRLHAAASTWSRKASAGRSP